MARKKNNVDAAEVDEIIKLKLVELGGIKSKLTYNNVWNFNKKIAKNPSFLRENGTQFSLYGYTFWASEYQGKAYLGKEKIDKIKNSDDFMLAGESFNVDIQDILILVDKYHKKPEELIRRLVRLFEKDRKNIQLLKEQNDKLNSDLITTIKYLDAFKEGFATLFYNSSMPSNSLNDVISLERTDDEHIVDELKNMFNNDLSNLNLKQTEALTKTNVVDIESAAQKRKSELEGLGF